MLAERPHNTPAGQFDSATEPAENVDKIPPPAPALPAEASQPAASPEDREPSPVLTENVDKIPPAAPALPAEASQPAASPEDREPSPVLTASPVLTEDREPSPVLTASAPAAAPAPAAPPARWRLSPQMMDAIEVGLLILVPVVLFASILLRFSQTALLSALVAGVALLPFFMRFENANVKPRDIMPIVVMAAIAVVLRVVMTPLFFGTPVSALVIIAGLGFGKRSGFMTGALIAIVSNLFLGQGPWTPWQMYSWGLMGYVSGMLGDKAWLQKTWQVCILGALLSLAYTVVLDTYSAFGFIAAEITRETVVATYIAGISYGTAHAVSTVLFLAVLYKPWMGKFVRIKAKYGLGADSSFEAGSAAEMHNRPAPN